MDYANEIKERLTMPQILDYYGFNINRASRIPCPFHNGKDANCGVREKYIHCFVCGESADAIKFVQHYFGVDFGSAVAKLNDDFGIGLPIGARISLRQRREMEQRRLDREAEKDRKKAEFERLQKVYWDAFDRWRKYDANKREYSPKSPTEDLHPLFVEAILNIKNAEFELSVAEMRLIDYENR